jgi:hypothetical protein
MKARKIIFRTCADWQYVYLPHNAVWRIKNNIKHMEIATNGYANWVKSGEKYTTHHMIKELGWKPITAAKLKQLYPNLPI